MSLSHPGFWTRTTVAALSLVLIAAAGCHNGPIYRATALPPEFGAPRLPNMHAVDLSRFSQSLSDSELLYPGDVISVSISTGLETATPIKWDGRIAEDGMATIPLVGPVQLAGLTLPQAEHTVRYESVQRGKFINPNVTIRIETRRSNTVTVVGAVNKPGTYQIPVSSSHVLAAISKAEGLTKDADTTIEIRHPPLPGYATAGGNGQGPATQLAGYQRPGMPGQAPREVRIDLEQATLTGRADVHLEDGSTVMVMQRPKRFIHVMGLVRKPDQFEMKPEHETRLLDAISMAGGRTLELADKVRVIRILPEQNDPVIIEASIGAAKRDMNANIRLAPGDVVSVEETPVTFVVGTIREFIRFGFTAGIPGI
jgi:polysaccharide export outer membrane protein